DVAALLRSASSIKSGPGTRPYDAAATHVKARVLLPGAMEVMRVIPAGLRRCPECGEYKGRAIVPSYRHDRVDIVPVSCVCNGIACRYCGERSIHCPTSNYYDERTGRVWHVPHFGALLHCDDCRRAA